MKESTIEKSYAIAKEIYQELNIDTDKVLETLANLQISIHCWQADDVGGFETEDAALSGGGIQATGNFPGKARSLKELRADVSKALSLIPGNHRLNLHASYGDFNGKKVDRNEIENSHFESWVEWAKKEHVKLDFNSTCYSHPKANDGYTLSSLDSSIRQFWIEHVKRCREISEYLGKELNSPAIHNIWVPDGSKDLTVNRYIHRSHLKDSLDEVFTKEYDASHMKDSIESKLFGIGSEAFVVGSHEFYMGYGIANNKMICLDMGHFHPTELVGDKISSMLLFVDELMLHVSRGVRWDSDHVVILNDEINLLTHEVVRANALNRVNVGLDFFDASINRVGAYVTGTRAAQKSFLLALLEPVQKIRDYENEGKYFEKLALMEEVKSKPFGAVWDYFCLKNNVPAAEDYISEIQQYEKQVLSQRR